MKFEIIIPNYNSSDILQKHLKTIVQSVNKDVLFAIVDDGSEIEQYEKLIDLVRSIQEDHNASIRVIRHEQNKGFSTAINSAAFSSKADVIALLNSDVEPEKGFLDAATKHFSDERVFGVGIMDKSVEGGDIVLRGRGIGRWLRGFLVHSRGEIDRETTLWISGGSSLIKQSLFVELGGFDELYNPFYWEDIDLSYRAVKSGYKIFFEKASIVKHFHEEGSIKKQFSEKEVRIIAARNQFIFVWENISDPLLVLGHLIWLPYHLIKAFLISDTEFLQGFILALFRFPDIIKKRRKVKKYSKISDKQVLAPFSNEFIS